MTTRTRRRTRLRYVHRLTITSDRVHTSTGWQVRMRALGVSQWFGDKDYGGVRRALRAALHFRDNTQLELWRPNG